MTDRCSQTRTDVRQSPRCTRIDAHCQCADIPLGSSTDLRRIPRRSQHTLHQCPNPCRQIHSRTIQARIEHPLPRNDFQRTPAGTRTLDPLRHPRNKSRRCRSRKPKVTRTAGQSKQTRKNISERHRRPRHTRRGAHTARTSGPKARSREMRSAATHLPAHSALQRQQWRRALPARCQSRVTPVPQTHTCRRTAPQSTRRRHPGSPAW
jgi:hypothetical protein